MSALRKAVQDYIEMRRSLGFKLHDAAIGLRKFVAFLEQHNTSHITGSNRALGSDDHVVLAGTAVPVGEMQLAARVLGDAWCVTQHGGDIPVGARAIAVPAILLEIEAG